MLTAESECTPCPAGWYCQQPGLTDPEGLCQQGYYCPEGYLHFHSLNTYFAAVRYRNVYSE